MSFHRRRGAQQRKRAHHRDLPRRREHDRRDEREAEEDEEQTGAETDLLHGAPYAAQGGGFAITYWPLRRATTLVTVMRVHTSYRTFKTTKRQEIIDITDDVEACRAAAGITEGMVLVSAMHISASVFVNDHEPGLWADILEWLEHAHRALGARGLSPQQRHGRGQRGGAPALAHDRARGHRAGHRGPLDFGPWQRVFYGEWDGQRPKRVHLQGHGRLIASAGARLTHLVGRP